MHTNLLKKYKPNHSDEFAELSCGLFIYNHQNLCCSQKLYLITWLIFFLMLKVLSNYAIIKCNLSNRNKDKASNQRLFLHSQILSEGVSCSEFTSVYSRTSRIKLSSFFLSWLTEHLEFICIAIQCKSLPSSQICCYTTGSGKREAFEEGQDKEDRFLIE